MRTRVFVKDTGFAERALIRPLIRRVAIRSAVNEAKASIEALVDLLNEHREPLGGDGAALDEQGIGLPACDSQGSVGSAAINLRKRNALVGFATLLIGALPARTSACPCVPSTGKVARSGAVLKTENFIGPV